MDGPAGAHISPPARHPRWDPGFADRCINDLMQHLGQWRDLGGLYASHIESFERCTVVRDAIAGARRVGLIIEGDRRLGYRLTGFKGFRYVHVNKALAWPPTPERGEHCAALPGQQSLLHVHTSE